MWHRVGVHRAVLRNLFQAASFVALGALATGCASIAGGPPRLYSIEDESIIIKNGLKEIRSASFSAMDEDSRTKYRNDWIGARMYAIDIQYTAYEAALTKERQNVGFGAAAATIGLTTASGLAASTASKDILTGIAGFVTGARAAYDNDILFAHSVQWVQSQMRTQRSRVSERIIRGTKASMRDYPLAAALSDLEEYYRAGTFTGGLIATSETIGADAKFSQELKDERLQVAFRSSSALDALTACVNDREGAKAKLQKFVPAPAAANVTLLLAGQGPVEDVLAKALNAGICP